MARRLHLSLSMSVDIDRTALQRLMVAGGAALVERMVALFLQNTPLRIASLRAGIDGGDWSLVERTAHSMKSSAAHLGLEDLRSEAARIEELAPQGGVEQLRPLIDRLTASFPSTLDLLTRSVQQLS